MNCLTLGIIHPIYHVGKQQFPLYSDPTRLFWKGGKFMGVSSTAAAKKTSDREMLAGCQQLAERMLADLNMDRQSLQSSISQVVEVTARAVEVLGSREKAVRWLRTPAMSPYSGVK